MRRRKEHDDEELDTLQRRALAKLEETMKHHGKSNDRHEKFCRVRVTRPWPNASRRSAEERATYAARLEAGKVPPLEQRDRCFAQIEARAAGGTVAGLAIVGIETYGDLCYLLFRDRERHHFYHNFDPRLEGLSDSVFDVYRIADRFEAELHRREGKPMNLADHLTEFCAMTSVPSRKRGVSARSCANREPPKPLEGDKTVMICWPIWRSRPAVRDVALKRYREAALCAALLVTGVAVDADGQVSVAPAYLPAAQAAAVPPGADPHHLRTYDSLFKLVCTQPKPGVPQPPAVRAIPKRKRSSFRYRTISGTSRRSRCSTTCITSARKRNRRGR